MCQRRPITLFPLFPFSFSVLYMFLVNVKGLESLIDQSLHQQRLLSPAENTAPETPRQLSCLQVHDTVTSHCDIDAERIKYYFNTAVLLAPACVCIRADCIFRRGRALKKQELKRQAEGEYRAATLDSLRKLMCFWSIKACKLILAESQNKMIK